MNLLKYFGTPGGNNTEHNGSLQWVPGENMPPLRHVQKSAITKDELESVVEALDFHRAKFRLWIPDEHANYCAVRDRASNGWYNILHIERIPALDDNKQPDQIVFLEWVQIYGEIPNGKRPSTPEEQPEHFLQRGGGHSR